MISAKHSFSLAFHKTAMNFLQRFYAATGSLILAALTNPLRQ